MYVFDDVVVKINQQPASKRLIRERNALALLRGSALVVPEFVADGESWIVMTRLPGEAPPDAALPPHEVSADLAYQLGAITAQLHNGPRPPGFGTWTHEDVSMREDYLNRLAALHRLGVDAQIVKRTELDAVADLLRERMSVLDSAPARPVLAHRDVQPRNALVDEHGRVTALLDFESAGGGDPAHDFGVIGLDWRLPGFAGLARGYRDAGGDIDAAFVERITYHVSYWALAVFAYLAAFLPHFLPVAREALDRVRSGELPPI